MARWISDLEVGFWSMHCPELYLCVTEACDVSSLELIMAPSRNGHGRSSCFALKAILVFYYRKSVHSGQCAMQFNLEDFVQAPVPPNYLSRFVSPNKVPLLR